MVLASYPGPGQDGVQSTGSQQSGGPSRGNHGPPPPLPPRPAGFGFQPLPSEGPSPAPPLQPGQKSTDFSSTTPHVSNSVDGLTQMLETVTVNPQPTGTGSSDNGPHISRGSGTPETRPKSSPKFQSSSHVQSSSEARSSDTANVRLQPVTECIGLPVSFSTTWYTHPAAPDYYICSYCYEENIRPSRFEHSFQGAYLTDGKARRCLFSRPRVQDYLFKDAAATGSLTELLNFMSARSNMSPCAGMNGVKGPAPRGQWYRIKDNQIPQMVICKACYEDYVLARHFRVNFEQAPEQPPGDIWACDFGLSFILEDYKRCAEEDNWSAWVKGASTRMSLSPCPGTKTIYPDGKQWFEPINGPRGFLVCSTCYVDYIHHTVEQTKWRDAGKNIARTYGASVKCCFGALNMSIAAQRTLHETYDSNLFWTAVQTLAQEPMCKPEGTTNATWYTLKADPPHYAICHACYVMVVKAWGVQNYFMHKPSIGKDAKLICCLNQAIPRFGIYLSKLIELMLTRDPAPLTDFAIEYGTIPICKRDNDFKNGVWYGWDACTICPECYHHFIRGTALADSMPIQSQRLNSWRMCEMYSPRMRKLYLEACASNPPDPTALLNFSVQRRNVYANTMMRSRQMTNDQQIKLLQQQNLNNQSLLYSNIGRMHADTVGYTHTYGQVGVGYGFRNEWELDGARYGQQAMALGDEIRSSTWSGTAGDLERQWRQVE